MKQSINFCDFQRAFENSRPNNFTREGLETLFDMLEEWEIDVDEELELDVIAFCCDFSEYASLEELIADYDCINSEDDIADHTWYRETETNGYIIQNF
jgi:hypothetical protein